MIWQIAAGSSGRDYTDRFLRHGMAFVGGDQQCGSMAQVNIGDLVILKRGMSQIVAVGIVVERQGRHCGEGDKDWLRDFDGWDLPAWCYVDWHQYPNPYLTSGLTRSTIQGVNKQHLISIAEDAVTQLPRVTIYEPEPPDTAGVSNEDLITELVAFGLRPAAAEELTVALRRIRILARFYLNRDWSLTKEHEARSFLVVPLLLALGWAEQKIQIEMNVAGVGRADIACFKYPVIDWDQSDNLAVIIETKSLTQGLDYVHAQSHRYAEKFPTCEVVIVTNGYCYKAFTRTSVGNSFSLAPTAYLNIMNPKKRYPLDPINVAGAVELLRLLIPR